MVAPDLKGLWIVLIVMVVLAMIGFVSVIYWGILIFTWVQEHVRIL